MNFEFNVNGKNYKTDQQTIALLRDYRNSNNNEMFGVVFECGIAFGKIEEV